MVTVSSIIAFDFGFKNIGVAVGQRITCTAQPLMVFKARNGVPDWEKLKKLLNEWQPEIIVVGLPLNIDGSEQPFTLQARKFAHRLYGRFNIQVVLHDERLSTVTARSNLFESSNYRALQKDKIDARSAVIILESWLTYSLN